MSSEDEDKKDLMSLKVDVEQLIELTEENLSHVENSKPSTSSANPSIDDEYLLFMVTNTTIIGSFLLLLNLT